MVIESFGFENTRYKHDEWLAGYSYGHCSRQGGVVNWTVYDGKDNFMGTVNPYTGEIAYAGEPTEYKETFLLSAKDALEARKG